MFSAYDLKYLDDPKGSFGGAEDINTLVRKGLEQDAPGAYKILDQFIWEPSDMESVMVEVSNGSIQLKLLKIGLMLIRTKWQNGRRVHDRKW